MLHSKNQNYQALEKKFEKISHLTNILSIAHWDSSTNLPSGSAANRNREIATLTSMIHEMLSDKEIGLLLEGASGEENSLNEQQKTNLGLMRREYENATCIDPEVQYENSIASTECEFIWRSARANNDFKTLVPYLDRVFDSVRKIAKMRGQFFAVSPYDALIDLYDRGRKSSEIKLVYDVLKDRLPELVQRVSQKQAGEKVIALTEKIDEKTQKEIGLRIMDKMGFNSKYGRLDKSTHPFCSGSNDDVRLTTRYNEHNFLTSLFGVIHEAGHGIYQQNLPGEYRDQPAGKPAGMAFHESQSLIMEMQAGTSREFVGFLARFLRDEFAFKGSEYSEENLYKLVTRVKPNFIRVDSDEVTYPLHVILRFEIEQEIVENNLKAKDLPKLWNAKMQEYLGIVPQDDKNGAMQDIHWPAGMVGYFPCYSNGAIISSMMMRSAKSRFPEIKKQLSQGSFELLNHYLNDNFRKFGSSKNSRELLVVATGLDQIKPEIFLEYLKDKYLDY